MYFSMYFCTDTILTACSMVLVNGLCILSALELVCMFAGINSGIVLVSDAIGAMGLPDGIHQLSDLQVEVCDGRAQLEGTDTLAGR